LRQHPTGLGWFSGCQQKAGSFQTAVIPVFWPASRIQAGHASSARWFWDGLHLLAKSSNAFSDGMRSALDGYGVMGFWRTGGRGNVVCKCCKLLELRCFWESGAMPRKRVSDPASHDTPLLAPWPF
jgi:hypothetical protein